MKLFYICGSICHYDMTKLYVSAEEARQHYPPSDLIVEAPDYVHENWGYDDTQEGDERFVKPVPPEGWRYDDATGTFEPIPDWEPPVDDQEALREEMEDMRAALVDVLGVEPEEGAE